MIFADTNIMSYLSQKMQWLDANARVHSTNIAFADKPGFMASTLEPFDKLVKKKGKELRAPDSGVGLKTGNASFHISDRDIKQTKGEVRPEWEKLEMTKNMVALQTHAAIYRKYIKIIRATAGLGEG